MWNLLGRPEDLGVILGLIISVSIFLIARAIYWHFKVTPVLMAANYDEPVISSAQLNTTTIPMAKGVIAGYPYSLLTNSAGEVMMFVTLRRKASLHMVAVSEQSYLLTLLADRVSDKLLEPVELEGDFPEHFNVFCTPSKQIELRQVLEPSNMQKLVDFCKGYNFEIFKGTLYVSQANKSTDRHDTTSMVSDVKDFIRNNDALLHRL